MSQPVSYPRVAALKTAPQFLARLAELGVALPFDEQARRPVTARRWRSRTEAGGLAPRNRFCILPMEGWDGTPDGRPTDLTRRRWGSFGRSGAALIWGGEAFAVRHDGRANPNQLALGPHAEARPRRRCATHLVEEHAARHRPDRRPGHRPAAHALGPLRAAQPGRPLGADDGLRAPGPRSPLPRRHAGPHVHRRRARRPRRRLRRAPRSWPAPPASTSSTSSTVTATSDTSCSARGIGPARYGGARPAAPRFLRRIVDGIRRDAPGLAIGVRLSAFDAVPFRKDARGVGTPEADMATYRHAFGLLADPAAAARSRADPRLPARARRRWASDWVCAHRRQPVLQPAHPAPGAVPAVGRLPAARGSAGRRAPGRSPRSARSSATSPTCGSSAPATRYLQEWLPHVGQAAVREGLTDFVGLGRMVLSYPALPADVLAGKPLTRARRSAAPSATAPAARATAWSRAASRSTRSTRRTPTRRG